MKPLSRRRIITTGLASAAGVSGLAVAAKIAGQFGLTPPDRGGLYGPGETLTYAAQRLLGRHSLAREFSRSQISKPPFANEYPPREEAFKTMQANGFKDWRLSIDGMVARPGSYSIADIKTHPASRQITQLTCEEGWSYIAEWTGVPLYYLLDLAGVLPHARYVAYFSFQPLEVDSIDMADALHPQTLVTYGMNGAGLPVGHGGPLRLRIPRQLGYKSMKFLNRITVTDDLKSLGSDLDASWPQRSYAWYAGI